MIDLSFVLILTAICLFVWLVFKKQALEFPFILSLGVTPLLVSIELQFLYLLTPHKSFFFYKVGFWVTGIVAFAFFLFYKKKYKIQFEFRQSYLLLIPLFVSLYTILNTVTGFDIFDPISYGILGKIFYLNASLADYPFITPNRAEYIFSWFAHPLGMPLIYSFLHLFKVSFVIPFVSVWYYTLTSFLVFSYLQKKQNTLTAILGTVFAMLVPVVVYLGKDGFAGSVRMFCFTALVIVLSEIKGNKPFISGLFTGLAMNTHLIGILTLPPSLVFFVKSKRIMIKKAILHIATAIFTGGVIYFNDLLKIHTIKPMSYICNFYPDFAKEFIKWHLERKGIFSFNDMIVKGILSPFTNINSFGLFFWIVIIFLIVNFKKVKKSQIAISTLPFLGLFLLLHCYPSMKNTFHMDARYIATFIPLITLSVFFKFEKNVKSIVFAILVFMSVFVGYKYAPWFYKHRAKEYKQVTDYINKFVDKKDGIISRRFPFTQYYCENHKTYSILDPKLAALHSAKNVNEFLQILKNHKIKYIITSRNDSHPFENKTFVKEILQITNLSSLIFKTKGNGFWLFKINNYQTKYNTKKFQTVFTWTVKSNFPVTVYLNKKNKAKLLLSYFDKTMLLTAPYEHSSAIFSLSKGKVWKKNVAYINVTNGLYKLSFKGHSLIGKKKIHPFLICYDKNGRKLKGFSGYIVFDKKNKEHFVKFKNETPFKTTNYVLLPKNTYKCIIGVNFYSDKGALEIEEISLKKAELF